jgi:hypothetical protein
MLDAKFPDDQRRARKAKATKQMGISVNSFAIVSLSLLKVYTAVDGKIAV